MPPLPLGAAERRRLEALQAPSSPSGSDWDGASSGSESGDEDSDMEVEGEKEEEEAAPGPSGVKRKRSGGLGRKTPAPHFTAEEAVALLAAQQEVEADLVQSGRKSWKGGKWPEVLRRMQQRMGDRRMVGRSAKQCQQHAGWILRKAGKLGSAAEKQGSRSSSLEPG